MVDALSSTEFAFNAKQLTKSHSKLSRFTFYFTFALKLYVVLNEHLYKKYTCLQKVKASYFT